MSVVQKLRHYYDKKGISAGKFDCPHYHECKTGYKSFVKAREAYVGRCYEMTRPRLMFLSLDPGKESKRKDERNMIALRKSLEKFQPEKNKHPHWYWTLMLAIELLRPLKPFKEEIGERNFQEVVNYIAHTNSAKCCQGKPDKAQADSILFKNCIEFIPGQLEILQRDVIVTQGDKAREVLEKNYEEIKDNIPGMRKMSETRIISPGDRKVLWIHTYHPTQRQSFFKRRNWPKRERYSRLIEGFLQAYR
jgi:hypothetical protein